ncbi:SO_0444 family Cu/Zn efflux transporter [Shewanella submarina]|uniref:SO_0444 family Cu/Zn efflux transporter n=1 Tax=Shewanella submarina TaxID=2016376 RepID=A0ABV7G522_9GAMM|nr:SO_0444 family Cu/Zn efflux transporter [Shewanella submarina]MCL1038313.1 SO_0444 family Cu/Zn efflux transporter [Shewanella submarina]
MLIENFLKLFLESAPWLLLGLVLAGLLKVFVPMSWMNKQLGGHGLKTTVKAALFGAPLPLCSCGVIPAAVGLRRSGASKAATTSFMVSTPETGIDSVSVSYVLLGPFMAIVRPIAAVVSAVVAGLLVGRDDDDGKPISESSSAKASIESDSCCSTKAKDTEKVESSCCSPKTEPAPVVMKPVSSCCGSTPSMMTAPADTDTKPAQSCCSTKAEPEVQASSCCSTDKNHSAEGADSCCSSTEDTAAQLKGTSISFRIFKGLHYAATDLVRDTAIWLLIGLFFAALVQTYVPGDFLAKWGDGILAMLVMVVISVPMYICATASTPIAAGLLLAGVSPGAVLVFMMAGPATNIATLGVVSKELGKRALYGYLGGVLGVALLSGVLVNYLVETFGFEVMPQIGEHHELLPEWIVAASGLLLAFLMGRVLWQMLPFKSEKKGCCS